MGDWWAEILQKNVYRRKKARRGCVTETVLGRGPRDLRVGDWAVCCRCAEAESEVTLRPNSPRLPEDLKSSETRQSSATIHHQAKSTRWYVLCLISADHCGYLQ